MSKRLTVHDYMDAVAERNLISKRLRKAGAPMVGIFWFIQEPGQRPQLLASGVPVQLGRADGIFMKGLEDHDNFWRNNTRSIKQFPASSLAFLQDSGPKDWPRGRVLFNIVEKRFEVHLDKQLQTPQFEAEILDYFHVPKAEASFASDPHYANARFTLRPGGPQVL